MSRNRKEDKKEKKKKRSRKMGLFSPSSFEAVLDFQSPFDEITQKSFNNSRFSFRISETRSREKSNQEELKIDRELLRQERVVSMQHSLQVTAAGDFFLMLFLYLSFSSIFCMTSKSHFSSTRQESEL